ncbi:hypothetical protein C8J46_106211 [Sphingomonas sp. PP-F2F-A104-K0414]|uniref:hypothetical protein n=1 Tax=Sphingomonas sp. PP-F2F-A104-K0414 TaxID=2135661 RepID=UPI0010D18261|nr:hypothetical protein [Sphingomonas sp. PP-F2F-A104-K0414]TCP97587.1 hypothetical protein C8J46_106211 [Sphingomonas sp. PP-F2F-A104-K0414]
MFRGFELSVPDNSFHEYKDVGGSLHQENKRLVDGRLSQFRGHSGDLLSKKMTAAWFPEIDAQVFISHAHKDSELALGLSGHLHRRFGLTSFVDSAVWGYANDLLKVLDDEFCYNDEARTYNYQKRNRSTSHVHMMLSVALSRMIDRCECIIFINTPHSISSRDYIQGSTTDSPWIYSEIAMTRLIEKRSPEAHRRTRTTAATESYDAELKVRYDVDLDHLSEIDGQTYNNWLGQTKGITGLAALTRLYDLVPPTKPRN